MDWEAVTHRGYHNKFYHLNTFVFQLNIKLNIPSSDAYGDYDMEKLNNLTKATKLINDKTGLQTQAVRILQILITTCSGQNTLKLLPEVSAKVKRWRFESWNSQSLLSPIPPFSFFLICPEDGYSCPTVASSSVEGR